MAAIIRIPDFPLTGQYVKPPSPVIMLFGRSNWQPKAARELEKAAGVIIRTDVDLSPMGPLHPALGWARWLEYFELADVIMGWCGNEDESFYLDQWSYFAAAAVKYPHKIRVGFESLSDHVMSDGLRFMLKELGIQFVLSLDALLTLTYEHCRQVRSVLKEVEQ